MPLAPPPDSTGPSPGPCFGGCVCNPLGPLAVPSESGMELIHSCLLLAAHLISSEVQFWTSYSFLEMILFKNASSD